MRYAMLHRAILSAVVSSLACTRTTQPVSDDPRLGAGAVRVTSATNGFPQDADGYRVFIGLSADAPSQSRLIAANGVVVIERVAPGAWRLFLDGMEPNCAATLPYPVDVTVTSHDTTEALMVVQCGPERLHRVE